MNPIVSSDLVGDYATDPAAPAQPGKLSGREFVDSVQKLSKSEIEEIFAQDNLSKMRMRPKRVPAKHKSVRIKARKQARLTRKANR